MAQLYDYYQFGEGETLVTVKIKKGVNNRQDKAAIAANLKEAALLLEAELNNSNT